MFIEINQEKHANQKMIIKKNENSHNLLVMYMVVLEEAKKEDY